MLGVWGAVASATRITHSADAVMARSEDVRTVQQFLRRYVSAAQLQPYLAEGDTRARMFEGDATSMRYVGPLPMQSGHAGLYVQTIRLTKDAAGGASLELVYQPTSRRRPSASPPRGATIGRRPTGCRWPCASISIPHGARKCRFPRW
jgi:hypothetical protein